MRLGQLMPSPEPEDDARRSKLRKDSLQHGASAANESANVPATERSTSQPVV